MMPMNVLRQCVQAWARETAHKLLWWILLPQTTHPTCLPEHSTLQQGQQRRTCFHAHYGAWERGGRASAAQWFMGRNSMFRTILGVSWKSLSLVTWVLLKSMPQTWVWGSPAAEWLMWRACKDHTCRRTHLTEPAVWGVKQKKNSN